MTHAVVVRMCSVVRDGVVQSALQLGKCRWPSFKTAVTKIHNPLASYR